jgi:hypothetical protein
MNKLLLLISNGAFSIADSFVAPREYAKPTKGGFQQDNAQLRGDVKRVGSGMATVIGKHGKQPHKSTGGR